MPRLKNRRNQRGRKTPKHANGGFFPDRQILVRTWEGDIMVDYVKRSTQTGVEFRHLGSFKWTEFRTSKYYRKAADAATLEQAGLEMTTLGFSMPVHVMDVLDDPEQRMKMAPAMVAAKITGDHGIGVKIEDGVVTDIRPGMGHDADIEKRKDDVKTIKVNDGNWRAVANTLGEAPETISNDLKLSSQNIRKMRRVLFGKGNDSALHKTAPGDIKAQIPFRKVRKPHRSVTTESIVTIAMKLDTSNTVLGAELGHSDVGIHRWKQILKGEVEPKKRSMALIPPDIKSAIPLTGPYSPGILQSSPDTPEPAKPASMDEPVVTPLTKQVTTTPRPENQTIQQLIGELLTVGEKCVQTAALLEDMQGKINDAEETLAKLKSVRELLA
jgi:hypothetical protein